jgi:hypothetical protein
MPKKAECKHDWATELHVGRNRRDSELVWILGSGTLLSTCNVCGVELDEMVIGGVVCAGSFHDMEGPLRRIVGRRKKQNKKPMRIEMG